jgi:hypothetical protein
MKSKVPAKIRAHQRWKPVPPPSTLDAKHQRHILNLLRLYADEPKHSEALEAALADVELSPQERLVDEALKRRQEPYRKEARKYAQVGLEVAESGYWEQAAYCAAMMQMHLANAKAPLFEADLRRAVTSMEQSERGRKGAAKRRTQRDQDLDTAARAWNKRMTGNAIKEPTLTEISGDTGRLTVERLKKLGGKNAIKARAEAVKFDEILR